MIFEIHFIEFLIQQTLQYFDTISTFHSELIGSTASTKLFQILVKH